MMLQGFIWGYSSHGNYIRKYPFVNTNQIIYKIINMEFCYEII